MGLSKASLLFALLFSAALLVSGRSARILPKKVSVEESWHHDHGFHGRHRHYPPDYYHHHHDEHHRHYPPLTERKTLESSDVKPDFYHHEFNGYRHPDGYPYGHRDGGYPYSHHDGGYPYGGYPYGHHDGGYPYGHHDGPFHGGYGGHRPQGN